jgi:hypothetical protein
MGVHRGAPYRRIPYKRVPYGRASHGRALIGLYLIGVHPIDVYFMDVHIPDPPPYKRWCCGRFVEIWVAKYEFLRHSRDKRPILAATHGAAKMAPDSLGIF